MARKIGPMVGFVFFSLFLLFSISAEAVPKLGVIDTDLLAASGGTTPVGMDGFKFPDDGRITVWWGNESGGIDQNAEVWIVTNAGLGSTFTVGSEEYTLDTLISGTSKSGNIDGYSQPYYGANLGSTNSNELWTLADSSTAPDLVGGGGIFYLLNGVFEGSLSEGDWIFAVADMNNYEIIFENGTDLFSPKTTSSVVPEPGTIILLGAGLVGLGILGRRKSKARS
jgi:hypothetical protein